MSFDDLYNNFKIVEQEVKRTASSSSSFQNMVFMSSPSSTNEVSTANTQVSTASTQVNTANLSDATVYAFLASQPNGSQLVHEDLVQIHEDDLEEIDLKWQLALLSMRTRKFFQKTDRNITINGSDTAGSLSKVECFNCHKLGHFARECRQPRNQDSRNRNQDGSRRTVNVEETAFNAMRSSNSPSLKDISNEVKESLDAPLVKELVSDDKLEKKTVSPTVAKREFVRPKKQEKPIKYAEMYRERVVSRNNYTRVYYNYSYKKAHPSAHKNMASRAVLIKTGPRPLNTVRPVNIAHPKTTVYSARPLSYFSKSAQSTVKRLYQQRTSLTNKSFSQKVNTAKGKFYTAKPRAVSTARPNSAVVNAVREN
nr:hypothetical protein [Tanacetum cinerariifolium]